VTAVVTVVLGAASIAVSVLWRPYTARPVRPIYRSAWLPVASSLLALAAWAVLLWGPQ